MQNEEKMLELVQQFYKSVSTGIDFSKAQEIIYHCAYWYPQWEPFLGFSFLFSLHQESQRADEIVHAALCTFPTDEEIGRHIRYARRKYEEDARLEIQKFQAPSDNPFGVDVIERD